MYSHLVWFLPQGSDRDPEAACVRILMRSFTPDDPAVPRPSVVPLHHVDAAFEMFAHRLAAEGFGFLYGHMRRHSTGPMLIRQDHGTVIGAIGPMQILPDSHRAARLRPQYFAVLPEYRGRGHGRALWRAAMRWGAQHRAAYQLVQTVVGGPSDQLYRSEGLTELGLKCTTTV